MKALSILARPAQRESNPYTKLIYQGIPRTDGVVRDWTLPRALRGHYDILHVHWPETVFDHSVFDAVAGSELLLRQVDRLRRRGARLVWTVHNLRAHGRRHPLLEGRFRRRWLARVDGAIALSPGGRDAALDAMPELGRVPFHVIRHPHYRGVYSDHLSRDEARSRLGIPEGAEVVGFVGRLAPYKGLPTLIRAFRELPNSRARLLIAGSPFDAATTREVERAASVDPRIIARVGYVTPERLQELLRASSLVALPFRAILNSGSAILALSFDRPVLVPELGALAELREECGEPWVRAFHGELTGETLGRALAEVRAYPDRTSGAHLRALDPTEIGRQTLAAFREVRDCR